MTDPQVPLVGPQASRAGPKTHLAGPQTSQAGLQTPLVGPYTPLAGPKSPSDPNNWPFDPLVGQQIIGPTDGWTYGRTEFLPILQDFVPCRGRCPKMEKMKFALILYLLN